MPGLAFSRYGVAPDILSAGVRQRNRSVSGWRVDAILFLPAFKVAADEVADLLVFFLAIAVNAQGVAKVVVNGKGPDLSELLAFFPKIRQIVFIKSVKQKNSGYKNYF